MFFCGSAHHVMPVVTAGQVASLCWCAMVRRVAEHYYAHVAADSFSQAAMLCELTNMCYRLAI